MEIIKPGDTIYLIVRKVSPNGLTRVIDPITKDDGKPRYYGESIAGLVISL